MKPPNLLVSNYTHTYSAICIERPKTLTRCPSRANDVSKIHFFKARQCNIISEEL